MKNVLIKSSLFGWLFFLLGGCYKDKGNYDYADVNEITIQSAAPGTISISQLDTLEIDIELEETRSASKGYSYEWTLYAQISVPLTRRVIGTEQDLKAKITELPGAYTLDLSVTDIATNISTIKRFTINVTTKYTEGWLVLEEKDGYSDLSIINPAGEVFREIYAESNAGNHLPDNARRVKVVRDRFGSLKVMVMLENGAMQLNPTDFFKIAELNDWYWAPPSDRKPMEYFLQSSDEVLLNNGKPYGLTTLVPAPYKFGLAPAGDYTVAPYEMYSIFSGFVFYNETEQNFTKLAIPSTFVPFAQQPEDAVFDVRNIGKKMMFAGMNTGYMAQCLFRNNQDDSVFVYTLDISKTQPAQSKIHINTTDAPGLLEADHFLVSRQLPHIYYMSGRDIYLLDIPAAKSRKLFSFSGGTEITSVKMYLNTKNSSDPDNNKLIVVSTSEAGEGKIYFFPIAATGDFLNNDFREVKTGFGFIRDIEFKRAP